MGFVQNSFGECGTRALGDNRRHVIIGDNQTIAIAKTGSDGRLPKWECAIKSVWSHWRLSVDDNLPVAANWPH
jgi:hypothetical protein